MNTKTTRARAGIVVVAAAAAALSACATSPYKRAGNAGEVAAALARSQPPAPSPRSLVFLVLGGAAGPRVAAYDLAASRLVWTQPGAVTTKIAVGGDVIVHGAPSAPAGGDVLVARDIGNGAVLWQHALADKERLAGYDVDAHAVYVVTQTTGLTKRGTTASVVALDPRTKAQLWRHELPTGHVAGPAVRGGLVGIPADSQYVILLDRTTGAELAQVLSTAEAATFVRALPEGMFYGSRGVFLLSPSTARGSRQSPGYLLAQLPAFVRPFYWYDMYRPEQTRYSAIDRNHILWRVAVEGDRARFRDDTVVVHDYRFLFGFDATSGALRWAYSHPSDAVASTDTGSVVAFVSSEGDIGAVDRVTGARRYQAHLAGEMVTAATFDADGFSPTAAASETGTGAAPDLVATLAAIVADQDRRFPDMKLFAIEEIGRQPGREATGKLLEILGERALTPLAVQKTSEALAARKDSQSADLLAAALRRHADYADDRAAPPVEYLARAVTALGPGGRSVTPELVAQLRLPETPTPAAAQIARALAATGAEEGIPALRDYLTMYRADPVHDADPSALIAVAESLLKLGSATERRLLLFVAEEPHTVAPLRAHLVKALGETDPGVVTRTATRD
ncbi:MAG TPA: PQQ-binding-like beta-propeller repeat protein [Polyangia bacterium]|jgi:outer membrane protein assembly factor BamB|nr:PQQ-binding-like beta-propeller repeat protein [Polyangia bacterium]